jgi:sugar lactone lactonase YvrE
MRPQVAGVRSCYALIAGWKPALQSYSTLNRNNRKIKASMNRAGKIISITPKYAIAGGEIAIDCEGFNVDPTGDHGVFVDGEPCTIVAASSTRILAIVPESSEGLSVVHVESGGEASGVTEYLIGTQIAEGMHIVANPAIDPKDESVVMTQSGGRGEQLPFTLYRLETDGYVDEMPVEIMNPTGLAFDEERDLYVTNRYDGVVCRIERGEEAVIFASGLGIATGIAFDPDGVMHVGDRSGTIYRIENDGHVRHFATLDPSVSAYHLAFGPDGRLYVASPGLSSHDAVHAIDRDGKVTDFFRGFGRPQGLAFDTAGNLYIAACYQGRHGIVRVLPDGSSAETIVAGNSIVGLCFTRQGDLIAATSDSLYSLPLGINGTLLK